MRRFAVIADVHGNRWALEAVLEDIARRGISEIVNAGDHLFGPLDPEGTADLLMGLDLPGVAGNQDREMLDAPPAGLSERHRDWLRSLPLTWELPGGILLFHGTPARDDVYLLESVQDSGAVSLAAPEEIAARIGETSQQLLLCGHTHIPRCVYAGGWLIVNPGSVGLQAYADDSPFPHVMENGSPYARYAILEKDETGLEQYEAGLERREAGWRVEQVAIDYDRESAAYAAERNGRPDWAWRLRSGRARQTENS